MNYKDTENYYTNGGMRKCAYCHSDMYPYSHREGDWYFEYYQCDCKQGKIEQQMNDEIEVIEKQIQEIKNKYTDKLHYDNKEIMHQQYLAELERIKEMYNE